MSEILDLKCEQCGCDYQKPLVYKEYLVKTNNSIFYKWSLMYCDECRREKERLALTKLPKIIEYLLNTLNK